MTTSSAKPQDLLEYMTTAVTEAEAMPATAELDRLVTAATTGDNAEFFTMCFMPPGDRVKEATMLAQELDGWVGVVATGFLQADGGDDPTLVVTVDDEDVIAALPPLMADPPGEVREAVEEGEDLYRRLAEACAERDHDAIEEIMAELERRSGEDALMAGFAAAIAEAGSQEDFETMLEDGMRPKNRPGFWGGVVDFFAGAWDAIWGTVTFLWDLSVVRMVFDPDGWAEDVGAFAQGVWHGITNPLEFLEAVVDLDGLRDNPARWFGALAPDAVLAFFTAGTGTAARRGVGATRALRELGDYLQALRRLDGLDIPGGGMGNRIRGFNRLLDQFDGDIARASEAMKRYLTRQGGLTDRQAQNVVDLLAGNAFNAQRRGHGTQLAEIELGTPGTRGPRVDAWDPIEDEIISRKYTQLGEVSPQTAVGYLDELATKYPPGTPVKITPTVVRKAEAAGIDPDDLPSVLPDDSDMILEVPPQRGPLPQEVIDRANDLGITIRDTDGVVLVGP